MADAHAVGREKLLGHLAMALFALLIAASFSMGARAVAHIEPGALNAMRFMIGAAIMGVVAYALTPSSRRRGFFRPKAVWRYLLLGSLMGVHFITMFEALKTVSPVSTGAIFTLMPFMSAGFAYLFLRQVTTPVVIVSLAVAAAGALWVVFRGDVEAMRRFEFGRGELIYLFGVAAHGAYAPLVRKLNRGEPVTAFSFWTLVGTWVCVSLYAAPEIVTTNWSTLPAIVWLTIAYLATFTTAGTYFLLQFAALRIPAGKAIAYGYMTPAYIIVLEGLAGAGWVSAPVLAGAAAILAGLVIAAFASDG